MDLDYLKQLAQLMKENDLSELTVEEDDRKVKLARGPRGGAAQFAPYMPPAAGAGATAQASGGGAEAAVDDGTVTINSPMVGTFYTSPSPDSDAFVKVGDTVDDETTVCIVEAMKVMNEIKAEMRGEIVAVLVQDADPVQFGTPLFRVRPH